MPFFLSHPQKKSSRDDQHRVSRDERRESRDDPHRESRHHDDLPKSKHTPHDDDEEHEHRKSRHNDDQHKHRSRKSHHDGKPREHHRGSRDEHKESCDEHKELRDEHKELCDEHKEPLLYDEQELKFPPLCFPLDSPPPSALPPPPPEEMTEYPKFCDGDVDDDGNYVLPTNAEKNDYSTYQIQTDSQPAGDHHQPIHPDSQQTEGKAQQTHHHNHHRQSIPIHIHPSPNPSPTSPHRSPRYFHPGADLKTEAANNYPSLNRKDYLDDVPWEEDPNYLRTPQHKEFVEKRKDKKKEIRGSKAGRYK